MINFRASVMRTLVNSGYRVVVVAPWDSYVENLKLIGVEYIKWNVGGRSTGLVSEIISLLQLFTIYRFIRPDVAFHFTIKPVIYGAFISRILKISFISVVTGLGYVFINDNWVSRLSKFFYRITLRASLEVWLLNKDDYEVLNNERLLAKVYVRLLPGEGVDVNFFSPLISIAKPRMQFLFLARLLRDKGVVEFVDAARLLRQSGINAEFTLLGPVDADNPTAITLDDLRKWQDEGVVRYLGTAQDVRPFISDADCVVLPSYREGLPRSLLEASSMERPVIATDVPGCRDVVVDGRTGYLCQARSATALALAMQRLHDLDEDQRRLMGSFGRKFVCEKFDESFVLKHYSTLLDKVFKNIT
jgi:glycosyltransferase involved in cell wall biosynthesis